jgi:polysaccharide biosynthesis protein PslH
VADLLYLVHRLPYPPDKGDKVRSYHLLKHLLQRHRVHLGAFVDDVADEVHVPVLRSMCADVYVSRLHPRRARLASLRGLLQGQALTLPYYRDASMAAWARAKVVAGAVDASVVFSSCMAQYTNELPISRRLVDFVDVDSAKWDEYARQHHWPMSWLYRREGRKLLTWERQVALASRHSFFATDKEAALFHSLAPESAAHVSGMSNGVDAEFFAPLANRPSPFAENEQALVFTGAMDYWPNVDAVSWFAQAVLPILRQQRPALRLFVVGRSPSAAVQALAGPAVVVTGTVPDVRPYLQHAAVVVAPLRLARGIQNKVLEAMAMARPVVAAHACAQALSADVGTELLSAGEADEYVRAIEPLLSTPERATSIGAAGRERVLRSYGWAAHLQQIEDHLQRATRDVAVEPAAAGRARTREALP